MKANALYHLMQLRARKLNENLPVDVKILLNEIQSSIKIKRLPGTYRLDWKVHQTDYNLTLNSDPFKFYEKGDNARHNVKRGDNLNYRGHNWDAALELWKDIFKCSNLDAKSICDDGKLAFGRFVTNKSNVPTYQNIGVALLFSLLAAIKYPLAEIFQLFITILVLLLFTESFSCVHLKKSLQIFEKAIIAAGCIIPLYYSINLTGIIFILSGLYLLGIGERQDKFNGLMFTLSGLVVGLATYYMGIFGLTFAVILFAILVIISIIDSQRISMSNTVLFLVGFITVLLGTYVFIESGSISPYFPQEIILSQKYINWITAGFLTLLFIGFAMWWIIGVQYYLLPWLSMFTLFIATLVTLFAVRNDVLLMLGVFSGFTLFVFERVVSGFFPNVQGSGRTGIKAGRNG